MAAVVEGVANDHGRPRDLLLTRAGAGSSGRYAAHRRDPHLRAEQSWELYSDAAPEDISAAVAAKATSRQPDCAAEGAAGVIA